MTRREELFPEIRRLREDEGLLWREIGERFGLALTTVQDYYDDPTGEKVAARKARFERPCERCGKPLNLGGTRPNTTMCRTCAGLTTRETSVAWILASFAEWNQRFGAPPSSLDWNPGDARCSAWKTRRYGRTGRRWPCVSLVLKHFGTWNDGLRAAGFEPLTPSEHALGHAGKALRDEDRSAA